MEVLFFMIPITIGLATFFLLGFFWANKKGQFDDLVTPAHRILMDDLDKKNNNGKEKGDDNRRK